MTADKFKLTWTKALYPILPFVFTVFMAMASYSVAQMSKQIDSKADKSTVEAACEKLKDKADNATIIQMLETLKQKDSYLEQKNAEQDDRINYNRDIMMRQLDVMREIKDEMVKLNKEIK